ncbi:helix-turn-helix domain-containing protein [Bacillus mycoides]|uniref:helix-turn-helix domain-containing protein n=1 Tax=Bacillus mycoides TaxID=1405 RepID=UPI003A7F97CE
MLTAFEQTRFVQETIGSITGKNIKSTTDKLLLFKVLAIAVDKALPKNKLQYSKMDEQILKNSEAVDACLEEILSYLSEYASTVEVEEEVMYSTTELSEIFGVSVQTIHNWVKSGKFIGVEKPEPNQHIEISSNTPWKARNGRVHLVSEFAKEWEEEKAKNKGEAVTTENEYEFLIGQVVQFEEKYGGEYKNTLGCKPVREMTAAEESDSSMWAYFLRRLETCR